MNSQVPPEAASSITLPGETQASNATFDSPGREFFPTVPAEEGTSRRRSCRPSTNEPLPTSSRPRGSSVNRVYHFHAHPIDGPSSIHHETSQSEYPSSVQNDAVNHRSSPEPGEIAKFQSPTLPAFSQPPPSIHQITDFSKAEGSMAFEPNPGSEKPRPRSGNEDFKESPAQSQNDKKGSALPATNESIMIDSSPEPSEKPRPSARNECIKHWAVHKRNNGKGTGPTAIYESILIESSPEPSEPEQTRPSVRDGCIKHWAAHRKNKDKGTSSGAINDSILIESSPEPPEQPRLRSWNKSINRSPILSRTSTTQHNPQARGRNGKIPAAAAVMLKQDDDMNDEVCLPCITIPAMVTSVQGNEPFSSLPVEMKSSSLSRSVFSADVSTDMTATLTVATAELKGTVAQSVNCTVPQLSEPDAEDALVALNHGFGRVTFSMETIEPSGVGTAKRMQKRKRSLEEDANAVQDAVPKRGEIKGILKKPIQDAVPKRGEIKGILKKPIQYGVTKRGKLKGKLKHPIQDAIPKRGKLKGKLEHPIQRQGMTDTSTRVRERPHGAQAEMDLDAAIYGQPGAARPPSGVQIPRRQSKPNKSRPEEKRLYVYANPAIHMMHRKSAAWYERKVSEIESRPGRKYWFGDVSGRLRWLQACAEEREQERERERKAREGPRRGKGKAVLPQRRDAQPWVCSRALDFGDVPEHELPDYVQQNPAWLKACEFFRQAQERREAALRDSESCEEEW
ncbi:hypothetical protein E4U57_005390 [Claviceps arundinis]|uniref:Uncharacterized protein n=1 Tax=Claviceps arundinis TaxID=1623583 RepID=A0ABQ7PI43_9HYPO|nr:hypothetical protein E4U57_005390 [Claviceps arundinis]